MNKIAQRPIDLGPVMNGLGTLGQAGDDAPSLLSKTISTSIGLITAIAGIYFLFQIITSGIAWMSSDGDKARVEDARKKITSSVIGLIIVVSAIFLVDVLGELAGIDILDLVGIIENLSP